MSSTPTEEFFRGDARSTSRHGSRVTPGSRGSEHIRLNDASFNDMVEVPISVVGDVLFPQAPPATPPEGIDGTSTQQQSSQVVNSRLSDGGHSSSPSSNSAAIVPSAAAAAIPQRVSNPLAKSRWVKAISQVLFTVSTQGPSPMIPIDKLQDMKAIFHDPITEEQFELDEETFIEIFADMLKPKLRSRAEIRKWFRDIDVDMSNSVSWDEFTSFMIHQAASTACEDHRSREFLLNPIVGCLPHSEHKEQVTAVATHERSPYFVTGGFDGLIKVWHREELTCIKTLAVVAAGHTKAGVGMGAVSCPIVEVVFNQRGTALFAAGVNKGVWVYDTNTWKLTRRFAGQISPSALAAAEGNTPDYAKGSQITEVTMLLRMDHGLSAFHVASPLEKEMFFVGLQNGQLLGYYSMRHAMAAEAPPLFSVKPHTGTITKVRYYAGVGIVCSSWDSKLSVCSHEDGRLLITLGEKEEGHRRAVLDFDFNTTTRVLASVGCDRAVYLWNPYFTAPLAKLKGHTALLQACSFNELDSQLVTLDQDNVIKVWDMKMYRCFQTITPSTTSTSVSVFTKYNAIKFDPVTSRIVACGSKPFTWTIRRALSVFPSHHQGHTDQVFAIQYLEGAQTLLTADQNTVMTWNVLTGRRTLLWDPNPDLGKLNTVSAMNLDSNGRRVQIAMKNGEIKTFNPRNAQVLREFEGDTSSEASRIVPLINKGDTIKMFAVVAPTTVCFYSEASEATGKAGTPCEYQVFPPTAITCAASLPSLGKTSSPIVLGSVNGMLYVYSSNTGTLLSTAKNPQLAEKPGGGFASRVGRPPLSRLMSSLTVVDVAEDPEAQPIEDMVYLPRVDLFAICSGDCLINFWDMRRNELKCCYDTHLTPQESILCLAVEGPKCEKLIASDDHGYVYVRDMRRVPNATSSSWNGINYHPSLPLLNTFRCHGGPITQLQALPDVNLLVTLGSDSLVKLWKYDETGTMVGYFGQKTGWSVKNQATWHKEHTGDVLPDAHPMPQPQRRPTSILGSRQGSRLGSRSVRSRHSSQGGGGGSRDRERSIVLSSSEAGIITTAATLFSPKMDEAGASSSFLTGLTSVNIADSVMPGSSFQGTDLGTSVNVDTSAAAPLVDSPRRTKGLRNLPALRDSIFQVPDSEPANNPFKLLSKPVNDSVIANTIPGLTTTLKPSPNAVVQKEPGETQPKPMVAGVSRAKHRVPGAPLHSVIIVDRFLGPPIPFEEIPGEAPRGPRFLEPFHVAMRKIDKEAQMVKKQSMKKLTKLTSMKELRKQRSLSVISTTLSDSGSSPPPPRSQSVQLRALAETPLMDLHRASGQKETYSTGWMAKRQTFIHEHEQFVQNRMANSKLLSTLQSKPVNPNDWVGQASSLLALTPMDPLASLAHKSLKRHHKQ